jgi:hypothetical protein
MTSQSQPLLLTAQANAGERFWIPIQTIAADGGTRPKLRGCSVSSALLCISLRIRAKGTAGTFQRGSFRTTTQFGNTFLKSPGVKSHIQRSHTALQAWMNSRNLLNIASAFTHRQPVILHGEFVRNRGGVCNRFFAAFLSDPVGKSFFDAKIANYLQGRQMESPIQTSPPAFASQPHR